MTDYAQALGNAEIISNDKVPARLVATARRKAPARKKPAKPAVVPFPQEWPPDPPSRDEMTALMTKEYDEHLARMTEIVRQALGKQARSRGICWNGMAEFIRDISMGSALPPDRYGSFKASKVKIPEAAFGNTYEDFSSTGLSHIRARRIKAWTAQMTVFRDEVIKYVKQAYLTEATMRKAFTAFGVALPVQVRTALVNITVQLPQDDTRDQAAIKSKVTEAMTAAFPGTAETASRAMVSVTLRTSMQ